jgi:hypothetical protein
VRLIRRLNQMVAYRDHLPPFSVAHADGQSHQALNYRSARHSLIQKEQMQIGWVKPPKPITGLDHLGTQSPCTLIYSQLLPGITNVTDRARYYSLYPWIVRSLDVRYKNDGPEKYVERFRRADCLLTLISERHARAVKDPYHGQFMIGRLTLVPALNELESGGELRLSTFATPEESKQRYFQNRLGGLGQYYGGQLAEMRILDLSHSPWVTYTPEGGRPLAETVDSLAGSDEFWNTVDRDTVSVEDLDRLQEFCACGALHGDTERQQLFEIFFATIPYYGQRTALGDFDPSFRRNSLRLLLHLAASLDGGNGIRANELVFRAAAYTGSITDSNRWELPDDLEKIREMWAIYQRNDMFSIACLGVFSAALHAVNMESRASRMYRSVESFASHLSQDADIDKALAGVGGANSTFSDLMRHVIDAHPPIEGWKDPKHEVKLAEKLVSHPPKDETFAQYLSECLVLLALLASREPLFPVGYGDLMLRTSDLDNYPIHLTSFAQRAKTWESQPLAKVMEDLVAWCLNTHLSVALRKLRQTRQCSFHLQPSEDGLRVLGAIPTPVATLPRINQSFQILADLGALRRSAGQGGSGFEITDLGRKRLEEQHG